MLLASLTTGFSHLTYSLPFIILPAFVPLVTSLSLEKMMEWTPLFLLMDMLLIPLVGKIVKRFEPWEVLCGSGGVLVLSLLPLWIGINGAGASYVIFLRLWIILWGVVFLCPVTLWIHELCVTQECQKEKYTVVGMGTALGGGLIGRMSPAILLWLWYKTEMLWVMALYPCLIFLLTIVAVYKGNFSIQKRRKTDEKI